MQLPFTSYICSTNRRISPHANCNSKTINGGSLKLSDKAKLTFSAETNSFQLIIPEKHMGIGLFDGNGGLVTQADTVSTEGGGRPNAPGPKPSIGTFYYDSWDDLLRQTILRFTVRSEADFNIVIEFATSEKKVAEYQGESDGIRGGIGSFSWSE